MFRKQKTIYLRSMWKKAEQGHYSSWDSCVVLTKMNLYRPFGDKSSYLKEYNSSPDLLDGSVSNAVLNSWSASAEEVGTVEFQEQQQFFKKREMMKSDSVDSGVELTSGENSPSTPMGSEHSFSMESSSTAQAKSGGEFQQRLSLTLHDTSITPRCCSSTDLHSLSDDASPSRKPRHRSMSVNQRVEQMLLRTKSYHQHSKSFSHLHSLHESQDEDESEFSLSSDEAVSSTVQSTFPDGPQNLVNFSRKLGDRKEKIPLKRENAISLLDVSLDCITLESEEEPSSHEPLHFGPGQGLRYLEQVCQMLEKIAHLRQRNLQLQRLNDTVDRQLRSKEIEEELVLERCSCGAAEQILKPEKEFKLQSHMDLTNKAQYLSLPNHCRTRSVSDAGVFLGSMKGSSPIHNKETKLSPKRMTVHYVSIQDLQDQLDGEAPPSREGQASVKKANQTQWRKVKQILSRLRRKTPNSSNAQNSLEAFEGNDINKSLPSGFNTKQKSTDMSVQ
ncbi:uncharacterized protein LOC122811238 [Protopterus annectens]|uniref:uncharacterized protein LOC122811238 n=1 Tax=Protopterus annectens TaxID=7888 RepID=UPI001CF975B8|nr:uncharacterized protein LOC122811238 [Protopterus annectens]